MSNIYETGCIPLNNEDYNNQQQHLVSKTNKDIRNGQYFKHLSELQPSQITVDFDKVIRVQNADPYLAIIKKYLTKQGHSNLINQLPHKMKSNLLAQRYHYRDNVLYYECNFNFLIVLPPTKRFYAIYPLKSDITTNISTDNIYCAEQKAEDTNDEIKSFYASCHACYKCGETTHTANNCSYNSWMCIYCGGINWNQVCVICHRSPNSWIEESENESETHRYNSSSSSSNSSPSTVNIQQKNGTTFYAQIGHKSDDYQHLNVSPHSFTYNDEQDSLVLGECDFSFSKAIIEKRGNTGHNMLVTAWYYYKSQWYYKIGGKCFSDFLYNLKLCKMKGAKITFGIDARSLYLTEKQWNKTNSKGFDVIIFTLPRVYHEKWSKIKYNKENESMLLKVLSSIKDYLNGNGEIHILLLKGQFFNFRVKLILDKLNLEIAYWCDMDERVLNTHFNGYVPRNYYGNPMKLDDYDFHFFSFKCKSIKVDVS